MEWRGIIGSSPLDSHTEAVGNRMQVFRKGSGIQYRRIERIGEDCDPKGVFCCHEELDRYQERAKRRNLPKCHLPQTEIRSFRRLFVWRLPLLHIGKPSFSILLAHGLSLFLSVSSFSLTGWNPWSDIQCRTFLTPLCVVWLCRLCILSCCYIWEWFAEWVLEVDLPKLESIKLRDCALMGDPSDTAMRSSNYDNTLVLRGSSCIRYTRNKWKVIVLICFMIWSFQ